MKYDFKFITLFCIFTFFSSVLLANNSGSFVLVIDPGHGGKDPGAIGAVLKLKEKDINLAVALKLGALLEKEKDVKVIYTRKTDVFVPLDERPRIANNANADLFISIHTNSAKNRTAAGIETYVVGSSAAHMEIAMRENAVILYEEDYKTRYAGFDPNSSESYIMFDFMQFAFLDQSINLASGLQDEFRKTSNRSDRGVRQAGFLVLKHTNMPSILVELGYISNPEEEKYLNQEKSQQELAQAIYNAFLAYRTNHEKRSGIAFNETTQSKPQPQPQPKKEEVKPQPQRTTTVAKNEPPKISYSVQLLTSKRKRPLDDKDFKKYTPIKEIFENGVYKYMYGEASTYAEILNIRREVRKHFSDAFVVVFSDGRKLTPVQARAYLK